MKMKLLLAMMLCFSARVWALGDTHRVGNLKFDNMVSAGWEHTCTLDAEGVKCWGDNDDGQTDVFAFKSPIQISAGSAHTCALDSEGVKCWGINNNGQTIVPALKSPIQVSSGGSHTCALDTEGVKCWGANYSGQLKVPALKLPIQVSAGGAHTCALDAEGVKCWGESASGQLKVPTLKSPFQISSGGSTTCALDADGVKCWGGYQYSIGLDDAPPLKSPVQISAGGEYICVLDAEGVKCWDVRGRGQIKVPTLKSPVQISVGGGHACALDAEGVKCWGRNTHGQTDIPQRLLFKDLIAKAIPYLTSSRAESLKNISKLSADVESKAYYLKLLLASPAILSVDSSYFVEAFLPVFKKQVEWHQKIFGYKGDIREVPDVEEHRRLAIVLIQSALRVSLEFIPSNKQAKLQDSLRATGLAQADPMNSQKIKDLVKQIDSLSAEKQKLKSSTKSAFLVDSLELAATWLREKVK